MRAAAVVAGLVAAALTVLPASAWADAGHGDRDGADRGSAGSRGGSISAVGHFSEQGSVSDDGRYVTFRSASAALVPGDTNATYDIFVRDVQRGITRRVSVGADGRQANGYSSDAVISGNGRYVAFHSTATNLVSPDTNGHTDLFLRDLHAGTVRRISDGPGGVQANGESFITPAITPDGRYVAFTSDASNLLPGNSGAWNVYVRDTWTGTLRRANVDSNGAPFGDLSDGPTISADGRFVAFNSLSGNDSDVFVRDMSQGTTRLVSVGNPPAGGRRFSSQPSISRDGRFVAFYSSADDLVPHDTNGFYDVFVRDLERATVRLVSISTSGVQSNAYSWGPSISGDGQHVTFTSAASTLSATDPDGLRDVFVHDLACRTTRHVSIGYQGDEPDAQSSGSAISGDGRYVVFSSNASNLTPQPDTNQAGDVFLRDLNTGTTQLISQPQET